MEDYKKKYDKALSWARNAINAGANGMLKEDLEHIFPELKWSEDKKIRKTLIELIKGITSWNYFLGISKEQMLAWLEKPKYTEEDLDNAYKCADEVQYRRGYEDAKKEIEKQDEWKLIDKIQLGKKYKCIASPRYSTFMIGEIYKPEDKFLCSLMNFCSDCFKPIEDGEQIPAWSEEDERHCCWVIKHFEQDAELYGNLIDWLKSLKERMKGE